jgi:uracil-DNA glycosylase
MTGRRSTYRSLASLQRDNRRCRACLEAGHALESLPVLEGHEGQRAYLYGQSPGVVEGQERRPWRGRAGQTLRRWLDLDEASFYRTFYCASVTRCYPGRSASGSGDRVPTPAERELCSFWFDWELRLLRPELIVAVGGLAIRRLLPGRGLSECIGAIFERADTTVIPLPHPSGVSRWLNASANQLRLAEALATIRTRLDALDRVEPPLAGDALELGGSAFSEADP